MRNEPRLLGRTPTVAFVDVDRAVWSVFDCRLTGGHLVIVSAGSPTANVRVFQGEDGKRLLYQFAPSETRDADPATLSAQRHAATPLRIR